MNIKKLGSLLLLFLVSEIAFANAYQIPPHNESLVGEIYYRYASYGDSVVSVAKQYDLGRNALENANPQLDMNKTFHSGALIQIPNQHLLPSQSRQGIVINLPEMRLYYYPEGSDEVLTYPIGIGKIGKTIPITRAIITKKVTDPIWTPPQDIREFNLEQGIVLPKIMPAGPDNPLGPYAIYMSIPTYLIHSTIFPESIGRRASFGCIRMYEADIETFFPSITNGIPVLIINSPVKIAWQDNHLYIEAHPPLEEHDGAFDTSLPGMVHMINNITKNHSTLVDWQLVSYLAQERDGIPHDVGFRIS